MVASEILNGSSDLELKYCYDEVLPVPRVKKEASDNYIKNRGTIQMFVFNDKDKPQDQRMFSYDEIKPVARVKREAEFNFCKNKGSIQACIFTENEQQCDITPRAKQRRCKPRCPSRASMENYELNRNGTICKELYGDEPPRPKTAPCPRVKPEAMASAKLNSGNRMKSIVNEFGQYRPGLKTQRLKYEGKSTSIIHKGGRMNTILTKYGQGNDYDATPRVKSQGKDNADLGKGKRMSEILTTPVKNVENPQLTPRVKKEAESNAYIGKGGRMQKILTSVEPDSPKPVPRVKQEAELNASLDRGTRVSFIVHDFKRLPDSPKLQRGVRSVEAKRIQDYGRGHIGQILENSERSSIVYKPGLQSAHYDIAPAY